MSSVIIGDSHGSIPMIREALRVAQHLGASDVRSVGDYGFWPGKGGKEFEDVVETMAANRNLIVKVAPGNHDNYDMLDSLPVERDGWKKPRPNIWAAPRGLITEETGGRNWLWCGGAASIDGPGGVWQQCRGIIDQETIMTDFFGQTVRVRAGTDMGGWWPQERITEADIERSIANAEGRTIDVVISHEVPHSVSFNGAVETWRIGVRQRLLMQRLVDVVQPRLHFGGHWHRWHEARLPHGGRSYTLSSDSNPDQTQWAFIEDDGRLLLPVWHEGAALTKVSMSRHKVDLASVQLYEPY